MFTLFLFIKGLCAHRKNRNKNNNYYYYAVTVISYTAGIISWTQNEIVLDRKIRKALNIYGALHHTKELTLPDCIPHETKVEEA